MCKNFYLYAPQVHQGGGKTLLAAILNYPVKNMPCTAIIDERLSLSSSKIQGWTVKIIKPSFFSRFACEKWLSSVVKKDDTILFYSNLPPLFNIKGKKVVFLQNRYLIDDQTLEGFSHKTRIRLVIQRLWFRFFIKRASEVIVQTDSMAHVFRERISKRTNLRVIPLMDMAEEHFRSFHSEMNYIKEASDFLYVATGDPHKNHKRLIEAWCLLALQSIKPTLHITVDFDIWPELGALVNDAIQKYGIVVVNHGSLSHKRVWKLYGKVDALIYPSLLESFGVPLIEASQNNLPILASELDYVRDLIDPIQSFDPLSAISIARAVKRFLCRIEDTPKIRSPKDFLTEVTK